MRLSIALEKQARINVNLKEGLDIETFRQLASILTDKAVGQPNDYNNDIGKLMSYPEELKGHIEKNSKVSPAVEISKFKGYASEHKTKVFDKSSDNNQEITSKGLVMVRCPKCKKIAVIVLYIKNGQVEYKNKSINCKNCQTELPITELKPAYYQCPDCDTTASFYVMGDLKEASCKNCGSVIDLVWNEKKKKYVSINLVK